MPTLTGVSSPIIPNHQYLSPFNLLHRLPNLTRQDPKNISSLFLRSLLSKELPVKIMADPTPIPTPLSQHDIENRYKSSGISVLIVGAGVGGLMAALECSRKGHEVRVIEKTLTPDIAGTLSLGTAIMLGLN